MNERTCQLCGKPLSRIRVGGGEEFCSREHRTQYRLRRGMDRLHEANKVASLMRRRETPKPITVVPVAEMVWQGYFQALPEAHPPAQFPRQFELAEPHPGLLPAGHLMAAPSGSACRVERRILERSRGAGLAPAMAVPAITVRKACAVARAGVVFRAIPTPLGDSARRSVDLLHRTGERKAVAPHLPPLRARGKGAAPSAFRPVANPANAGMLLRVSRAVGFRLPAQEAPGVRREGLVMAALRWPELLGNGFLVRAAAARCEAETMQVVFTKQAIEADCRWRPEPYRYPGAQPPEAVKIGLSVWDFAASIHPASVPWPQQDYVARVLEKGRGIERPGLSPAFRLLTFDSVPAPSAPAGRFAVVPFGSSDISLGYPEEEQSIQ